jgi:hypothetical protein
MKPKLSILLFVMLYSVIGLSQTEKEEYKFGFDFVEGIYLSYEEFVNNSPSIKMSNVILIKPLPRELEFINKRIRSIIYLDENGKTQNISAKTIWGLCIKNEIYIQINDELNKLIKIGSICYFIEDRTPESYQRTYSAYGNVGGESSLLRDRIHVFDIDSGTILSFKQNNFEKLIVDDSSLYNEFNSLGDDATKSKYLFRYLELYNERNPVYFPIYPSKILDTSKAVEIEFD